MLKCRCHKGRLLVFKAGVKYVVGFGLISFALFLLVSNVSAKNNSAEIKSGKVEKDKFLNLSLSQGSNPLENKQLDSLSLDKNPKGGGNFKDTKTYLSEEISASFSFNAIGAKWEFVELKGTEIFVKIKIYDGQVWSDWQTLAQSDLEGRDDKVGGVANRDSGVIFSDLVFAENGQKFQYQIDLKTENLSVTPRVNKIEFNYIDSTAGPKAPEYEKGWFKKVFASDATTSNAPTIISRTAWGCPEKETSPRWLPQHSTKSFQVYHHTVSANGAEPYSTMRAVWYYQANTRGWGDIGYNYLVDRSGRIFKGRNGRDNVIGAHVYGYNTHSIGVAVLGTYVDDEPPSAAISGLANIFGYSAYRTHSGIKLYGHRELTATQCPGNKLFARKSDISLLARKKLASYSKLDLLVNNDIYYYRDKAGKIRRFASGIQARDWGFDLDYANPVTDEQIAAMEVLPAMKSFAKYNGSYYLVTRGVRYPITSNVVKSAWGANDSNSVDVSLDVDLLTTLTHRGPDLFRFMRKVGASTIYIMENGKKRPIPTRVFEVRGFNPSLIVNVSSYVSELFPIGQLYPYPTGVKMRASGRSTVYYCYGNYKRPISAAAKRYLRISSRSIIVETPGFVDAFQTGNSLLMPPGRILNVNGLKFLVTSGFHRKYIPQQTVFDAWHFSNDNVVAESLRVYRMYQSSPALTYPSGVLVRGSERPSVYFMDLGQRKFVSLQIFTAWNLDDDPIINAPQTYINSIPHGGSVELPDSSAMYYRKSGSSYRYFYISNGKKRYMPSTDIYRTYRFRIKSYVSMQRANLYPNGENLYYRTGTLIRGVGLSGIYYMESNKKRPVSSSVFKSWKFNPLSVRNISVKILDMIPTGTALSSQKLRTLLGPYGAPVYLPAYSGKTAREQHLWLSSGESASHHYAVSGTPTNYNGQNCRNGMAGGYGAFGQSSVYRERYYVNMRWLYAQWYQDGEGNTKVRNLDPIMKSWHRHKKLIVTNPLTHLSVVVSIEESGPAIWTGRVSGLSPEAMAAIKTYTNDNLTYYWAGSQSVPLGPIK